MNALLGRLALPYGIHRLVVGDALLEAAPQALADVLPPGRWLLVADDTTWTVAGQALTEALRSVGRCVEPHRVRLRPGRAVPLAGDAEVALLTEALGGSSATAAVAVGAGTVNDITKLASFRAGIPYAAIATAPSMNGYTSGIAAILSAGVKTTEPCHLPVACLADVEVLGRAPQRLLAAGLGDLLSRPVSCADWYLSHRLLGTEYPPGALELIGHSDRLIRDVAPSLPARQPNAVAHLTAALLVSGLAMGAASTSAPASGGEHLISHYLDMTHYAEGEPHDLHGCQVGVATLVTATLYEQLLSLDPAGIDVAARRDACEPWARVEPRLARAFGALAPAVLPHARSAHAEPHDVSQRLALLKNLWPDLTGELRRVLRPAADIRRDLETAGCPFTFAHLGISPERARRAALLGRHVRARYTILDLAAELGLLEAWLGAGLAAAGGAS